MDNRQPTWVNIGTEVKDCKTVQEVLQVANLDYTVKTAPLIYTPDNGSSITIPDRVATYRENDNHYYGIVSKSYTPVQNADAFDFVNYIEAKQTFVKAGETEKHGCFIISELEPITVLGDTFTPHAIFRNSHDGSASLGAVMGLLRIVCQNQFNALARNDNNAIVLKHSKNVYDKMEQARVVLRSMTHYIQEFKMQAEKFATVKLTPYNVDRIITELFPIQPDMNERQLNKMRTQIDTFKAAVARDDNRNFKDSLWGLINALADYETHKTIERTTATAVENKFVQTTFVNSAMLAKLIEIAQSVAA